MQIDAILYALVIRELDSNTEIMYQENCKEKMGIQWLLDVTVMQIQWNEHLCTISKEYNCIILIFLDVKYEAYIWYELKHKSYF